jgi:hypothetical protein
LKIQKLLKIHNFKLWNFRLTTLLKKQEKNWNNIFETCSEFFLVGKKEERDEGGGTILQDNNIGGRAVLLQPVRFQYIRGCIPIGLYTHTHMQLTQCTLSSDLH